MFNKHRIDKNGNMPPMPADIRKYLNQYTDDKKKSIRVAAIFANELNNSECGVCPEPEMHTQTHSAFPSDTDLPVVVAAIVESWGAPPGTELQDLHPQLIDCTDRECLVWLESDPDKAAAMEREYFNTPIPGPVFCDALL